ncbi:hypothetical protein OG936_25300 [Streptomyces sp. NBC_00846]|uniref:hypothetical protein n=1 Tax=Streptomyces sp. NBC_00846 TaxID=2975849 RepID=UPI00386FA7D3|nr:hypothetical protein OG936_25300 [Streptomyces sp. NBC_00846]
MYTLELHKMNATELRRRADRDRLVQEILRARRAARDSGRAARRDSGSKEAEGPASTDRNRFVHAAQ